AQDALDVVSVPWNKMDATTRDILIILGAVALVTLFALFWAVVFRSKRRPRHHHHHHHHRAHTRSETTAPISSQPEPAAGSGLRRKRRRHRRREHRTRNPTLAETGGLPPLRSAPPPEP